MEHSYSYLAYSLIFLAIWLSIFIFRSDLRKKMLLTSVLIAPLGPVSELWYLRDYWVRPTVTGTPIGLEDVTFAFSLGGILFSLYKVFGRYAVSPDRPHRKRAWIVGAFPLIILSSLILFTNVLGVNSIFSSAAAFLLLTAIIWFLRPDLRRASLLSGVLSFFTFLIVYRVMELLFPGVLASWCSGCNPSGLRIAGVNVEELLWDFSWGAVGGVIYEAASGRTMVSRLTRRKRIRFGDFRRGYSERWLPPTESRLGGTLKKWSGSILAIGIVQGAVFWLERLGAGTRARFYAILLVCLTPFGLDVALKAFGFACRGEVAIWLAYLVLVLLFAAVFPHVAWGGLTRLGDAVSSMISREDEEELVSWLKSRLRPGPQLALSGLVAVAAPFAAFHTQVLLKDLPPCPAGLLAVAWSAALGANCVYWLWHVPLLIKRIHAVPRPRLRWHDPAATPAVRGLSRLLGRSALLAATGAVVFQIPVLYAYAVGPTSEFIRTVIALALFVTIGILLLVSFFPQYWLTVMVRRGKQRILDELSAEIENLRPGPDQTPAGSAIAERMAMYDQIARTANGTVDVRTLLDYALSIALTLVPTLLQLAVT